MKPFLVLAGDRQVDDITALVLLSPDAVACKRLMCASALPSQCIHSSKSCHNFFKNKVGKSIAMTAKEFLVSFKDDDGLWPNLQADCDQLLRLRDVPFKCTALAATRMIEISVKFTVTRDAGLSSETGAINWQRMPFVYVYLFKCEDSDAYKSGLSSLKQWIDLMNDKNQEWLVLYFPQGSSNNTFSTTSAKYRKVWEKLRSDIKPVDRLCKHDLNSGKATEFVNRTRDALVASIDARISTYEKGTGAMLTLGRQTDGWCPSNWILAKDTIAQIFEHLGLTSQALSVLDEISAVVDNPVFDVSLKFPSLVRDHCNLNILESNSTFFRDLFKSEQASEVDARQYLFSRRFSLLENLHRLPDAASLSVRVCRVFFKRLFLLLPSKSPDTNPLFPFSWAIELCDAVCSHLAGIALRNSASGSEDSQNKQSAVICAELLLFSRELLCSFKTLVQHSDASQSMLPVEPAAVREIEYVRSNDLAASVRERSLLSSASCKTQVPVESFDDDDSKVPSDFIHRLPFKPSVFSPDIPIPSTFKEHASTLGFGLLASALSSKQALQRAIIETGLRAASFFRMAGRYRSVCLLYKEIGEELCQIDASVGSSFLMSCMNVWVHEGWVLPIISTYPSLFDSYKKLELLQPLANLCVKLLSSRFELPPSLSLTFETQLIESVTSFNSIPMVTGLPDIFQISLASTKDDLVVRATEKCNFSVGVSSLAAGKFPIDLLTISFAPVVPKSLISTIPSPPTSPARVSSSNPSSPAPNLQTTPQTAFSQSNSAFADTSNQVLLSLADTELSCGKNQFTLSGVFPAIGCYSATLATFQIGVLKMILPMQNDDRPFVINVKENNLAATLSFAYLESICTGFWNSLCVEVSSGVLEDVSSCLQLDCDGCEFHTAILIAPGPLSSYSNSANCIASSVSCQTINLSQCAQGSRSWDLSPMSKQECFSICICFKPRNTGLCSILATLNASSHGSVIFSAAKQCDLNVVDCVLVKTIVSPVNRSMFVSVELESRQVSVDLISSSVEVPACFTVVSDLSSGFNTRSLLPGQLLGLGAQISWKHEGISVGGSDCSARIALRLVPVHDVRKELGLLHDDSKPDIDTDSIEDFDDNDAVSYFQMIELPCVTSTVRAEVAAPPFSVFGRRVSDFLPSFQSFLPLSFGIQPTLHDSIDRND